MRRTNDEARGGVADLFEEGNIRPGLCVQVPFHRESIVAQRCGGVTGVVGTVAAGWPGTVVAGAGAGTVPWRIWLESELLGSGTFIPRSSFMRICEPLRISSATGRATCHSVHGLP